MLVDGELQIIHRETGVEAPIPFHLRFNRLMSGAKPRPCPGVDNQAMKLPVNIEDGSMLIRASSDLAQLSIQESETEHDGCPLILGKIGGKAPSQTFEASDN